METITQTANQHNNAYFFSGYDCDSLAMEHVSGFLSEFLPFFERLPQGILELRTKSTNIRQLLRHHPLHNVVVAFSFTPQVISKAIEYKVPRFEKRLEALKQVAAHGWKVGLRLDPLIYADNFYQLYQELIEQLFNVIEPSQLHSVSIGALRFPEKMYQHIQKLYPEEKLLAQIFKKRDNHVSYDKQAQDKMKNIVTELLSKHISTQHIFECNTL